MNSMSYFGKIRCVIMIGLIIFKNVYTQGVWLPSANGFYGESTNTFNIHTFQPNSNTAYITSIYIETLESFRGMSSVTWNDNTPLDTTLYGWTTQNGAATWNVDNTNNNLCITQVSGRTWLSGQFISGAMFTWSDNTGTFVQGTGWTEPGITSWTAIPGTTQCPPPCCLQRIKLNYSPFFIFGISFYFANTPQPSPSKSPTLKPTNRPTDRPTLRPTFVPTKNPTETPTKKPTNSPTKIPSLSPSVTPTKSPTICSFIDSVDGYDYVNGFNVSSNQTQIVVNSLNFVSFINTDQFCNDVNGCQIYCQFISACLSTNYICNGNKCDYVCDDRVSCFQGKISNTNTANEINIKCNDETSCRELNINVNNLDTFSLECNEYLSCQDINLILTNINNATIICINENACQGLTINTNWYNSTTLIMWSYSSNINYFNGFGLDDDVLQCNDYNRIHLYGQINWNPHEISNLINITYPNLTNTCAGVRIHCNNGMIERNCDIEYSYLFYSLANSRGNCLSAPINEFTSIKCIGECFNSPTLSPLPAPTQTPTIQTINPTLNPSSTPTETPTLSPTIEPTNAPTDSPTTSPTDLPTFSPTPAPSEAPTTSPSSTPTTSPTPAPTESPTPDPTRSPLESGIEFFGFIVPEFILANLSVFNINTLFENPDSIIPLIDEYIENGLLNSIRESLEETFQYSDFSAQLKRINGIRINNKQRLIEIKPVFNNITIEVNITCNRESTNDVTCGYIQRILTRNFKNFETIVSNLLRDELNNDYMSFTMTQSQRAAVRINEYRPDSTKDFMLFFVIGLCSAALILMIVILLHNNDILPIGTPTDDTRKFALLKLSFQFYDFVGDINFALFMFQNMISQITYIRAVNNDEIDIDKDDINAVQINRQIIIYFILGIGTVLFTIGPLILNIIVAINIKKNKIIKNNKIAYDYFNNSSGLFIALTVLSGSSFAAIETVNCNLFGLDRFNAALSDQEIKQLTRLKITTTILAENLPQLCFQIVYIVYLGSILEQPVLFACIGSILSILLTCSAYYMDKQDAESVYTQYYLEYTTTHIASQDQTKFRQKYRKTKLLNQQMNLTLDLAPKNIQIQPIIIIKNGIIMRITQNIKNDDLHEMTKTLQKKKTGNDNANIYASIKPEYYTKHLFLFKKGDISELLFNYFGLSSNMYTLNYYNKLPDNLEAQTSKLLNNKLNKTKTQLDLLESIHTMSPGMSTRNRNSGISVVNQKMKQQLKDIKKLKDVVYTVYESLNNLSDSDDEKINNPININNNNKSDNLLTPFGEDTQDNALPETQKLVELANIK